MLRAELIKAKDYVAKQARARGQAARARPASSRRWAR